MKPTASDRLSFFLPSLGGGGAERAILNLANSFADKGYPVDLLLGQATGPYLGELSDKVNLINLNCRRISFTLLPLIFYIRTVKPRAILSAMTHTNVIASVAGYLSGTKAHVVISERTDIRMASRYNSALTDKILYLLVPLVYRLAFMVTAVSREAANSLQHFCRLPPNSVKVLYSPFEISKIKKLSLIQPTHPWFQENEPPVVLGMGRLAPEKDFSSLIRAFARSSARSYARLVLLGNGPLQTALEAEAFKLGLTKSNFQIAGFKRNPFKYVSRSSLFVLSSQYEGLPAALVEAMACGTPVVSTNCQSGPCEILQNGRWGAIVPVSNYHELSNAIDYSLQIPRSEHPDVSLRAEVFDVSNAVSTYLGLLTKCGI